MWTKKAPSGASGRGRREAERMKRIRGVWYYNGKAYPTLRAALERVWIAPRLTV